MYPIYKKWGLVVPTKCREQVLWNVHNEPFSGHMGINKIYEKIDRDFYWPSLCQDVKKSWTFVAANLMHFSRSSSQNKFLVVLQDLFTKWVKLKPTRAATAEAIALALEELILFRWNKPKYCLSDNGSEFDN